jgi:hypothetical protein
MFTKSVLFSSLLALAMGKPVARRNGHLSGFNINPIVVHQAPSFDLNSISVTNFNPGHFSFNNFGGLSSLNHFDEFFGQGNFCGVQNVLVQQNVVTCQVTQVNIIQQHLAIVAEYAKRVILTQSCETESQVLLFSQWLGGLVNWGHTLRRVNGVAPTFDVAVANQIVNVVDVSNNIVVRDFGFVGSNIGSHAVTVIGDNWINEVSPSTVGFVWESAVLVAGPEIPLGVHCSSPVCVAPHVNTAIIEHVTTVQEHHPLPTIVQQPTIITHEPVHLPPVVVHQSLPVINIDSHANTGIVFQKGESVSTETSSADIPLQTEPSPIDINGGVDASTASVDIAAQSTADVDIAAQNTGDIDIAAQSTGDIAIAGVDTASAAATETTTDAAAATATDAVVAAATDAAAGVVPPVAVQSSAAGVLNGRRLPTMIARRAWDSRRRV